MLLLNTDRSEAFDVRVGDRIAQLVVTRIEAPDIVEVQELAGSDRGERGFGSTGS